MSGTLDLHVIKELAKRMPDASSTSLAEVSVYVAAEIGNAYGQGFADATEGAAKPPVEVPDFLKVQVVPATAPDRTGAAWTDAEDQRALALAAEGKTPRQIAAAIGRPFEGTRNRLKALKPVAPGRYAGKPAPKGAAAQRKDAWTPELDQQLADLKNAGRSIAEIAAEMGRGEAAISMRLRQLRAADDAPKLPFTKVWNDALDQQLIEGRMDGRTYDALAAEMGMKPRALENRITRLKAAGKFPPKPTRAKKAAARPAAPANPAPDPEPLPNPVPQSTPAPSPAPSQEPEAKPQVAEQPAVTEAKHNLRAADPGDLKHLTIRQRALVHHLNALSDDFTLIDDLDIIEDMARGAKPAAIADSMGCQPRDIENRFKRFLVPEISNWKGYITIDGQEDLMIALRHLVAAEGGANA